MTTPQDEAADLGAAPRNDPREEAHEIAGRLVAACTRAGLVATQNAPTRIRVASPKSPHPALAEVIRLGPGEDDGLYFYWSWGQVICPATEVDKATDLIAHVVTPKTGSRTLIPPTGCSGV